MKLACAVALFFASSGSAFTVHQAAGGTRSSSTSTSASIVSHQQHGRRNGDSNHRSLGGRLFGILDEINSDSYDLFSLDSQQQQGGTSNDLTVAYERMLGEIVFSTTDPRVDIFNKLDLVTDPAFLDWLLNEKIGKSRDPEERLALKDLYDIILDVQTRVQVNQLAEERAAQDATEAEEKRLAQAQADTDLGRTLSTADVLKRATRIQTQAKNDNSDQDDDAPKTKKSFLEQELTPEIRLSYQGLLQKVLPPYKAGDSPASIVFTYYEQFDAQFIKLLAEKSDDATDATASHAKALLEALAIEQQKRLAAATESLKLVLSAGDPMRMEGAIVKLSRDGKVDEPFLLLLEANENQAKQAGAAGPAQLMARLRKRAMEEKDKQAQSKEIRLIRQLLRTNDSNERERLLEEAFTPRAALLVPGTLENAQKAVDGEMPEQEKPMPDVPPPDFINACKAVLLNFGNLATESDSSEERGDLASRIKKIAAEAEVVATRIYGKGMTLREQQDRMWSEATTSIFDLERMEMEAERNGETAPWANPDGDTDMMLPGFDSLGRMQVGGS